MWKRSAATVGKPAKEARANLRASFAALMAQLQEPAPPQRGAQTPAARGAACGRAAEELLLLGAAAPHKKATHDVLSSD